MGGKRIFKAIFSVTGVLIVAKIVGFIKQMVTAGVFGATIETDIIYLSQEFIANIEYILAHTVTTAFVAVYISVYHDNREKGDQLVSDTIKVTLLGVGAIAVCSFLISPLISKVLAPSYSPELSALLSNYIKVYSPVLIFFATASVFTGLLNSKERFVPGQLAGLFLSVITIFCVLVFKNILGVNSIVVSFLFYAVFDIFFVGILSKRYWSYQKGNPFNNPDISRLFRMMGPLAGGYAMIFINQQVDKIIVSGMEAGTVTAMSYASVLSNLVTTLTSATCAVLFTHMAVKTAKGEHKDAAKLALTSAALLITALLPIMIITIMRSSDVVELAFGRGAFDENAVKNAGLALMGYAFCFVPFAIKDLYSRFQYGRQDTKRPMINTTIGICVNIMFSILLSRFWGVFGVTIASSFSEMVAGGLNMRTARKHSEYVKYKGLLKFFPAWTLGTIMCILTVLLGGFLWNDQRVVIRFFLICAVGFMGYSLGVLPWILRYKSVFLNILKRKG